MSRTEQTSTGKSSATGFVPGARPHGHTDALSYTSMPPLASAQQEILDIMEGRWSQADDEDAAQNPAQGLGKDVVLAMVGAGGILAGLALLFFATAVGAVVLVLGCVTCVFAFEHALVADTASEDMAVAVPPSATMAQEVDRSPAGVRRDN